MRVSTFFPTHSGLWRTTEGYTATGRPKLSAPKSVRLTPIRLSTMAQATSIRTDKSGSKSRADESSFKGRALVHPNHAVATGDVLTILGIDYEIDEVLPRYEMGGVLNHYQVDLKL